MKKTALLLAIILAFPCVAHAEDTWKELFATRLMKLMTNNPTYTDVALTDIDQNGVPEAFLLKKGVNGGINSGITFDNNMLVTIEVPYNVTGACLEDITVYNVGNQSVFVGKEIGRYVSQIEYYKLSIQNNTLVCDPVKKSEYAIYTSLPYEDVYDDDFYVGDYPNRSKISTFLDRYDLPTYINVKPATAKISVNGNTVDMSGVSVNGSNYYKIRDVAMVLSTGLNRFSVSWDANAGAISITTGKKYTPVGGELSGDDSLTGAVVKKNDVTLVVNGAGKTLTAYNINGNNYFKIRDLSDLIGFGITWDGTTNTIAINDN